MSAPEPVAASTALSVAKRRRSRMATASTDQPPITVGSLTTVAATM
jgi:hypothetical protein